MWQGWVRDVSSRARLGAQTQSGAGARYQFWQRARVGV